MHYLKNDESFSSFSTLTISIQSLMTHFMTDWIWGLLISFQTLKWHWKKKCHLATYYFHFSHLEMGIAKSPFQFDSVSVEGKWDNECEIFGKCKTSNKWEPLWGLSVYSKMQLYLPGVFKSCARIYKIGPLLNLHPSSVHRDSLLKTFMNQNFTSPPGHYMNSLYVFAKVY